jgi:hypothetical protein
MKVKMILFLTVLLCAVVTASGQKTDTVMIYNYRSEAPKNMDINHHKDKDVVVYVMEIEHNNEYLYSYMTTIYRLDKGNLKNYDMGSAYIRDKKNLYDKAVYKWINDSTIILKFLNSSGNYSENLKLIGTLNTSLESLDTTEL